jgi:hypothetical protein
MMGVGSAAVLVGDGVIVCGWLWRNGWGWSRVKVAGQAGAR